MDDDIFMSGKESGGFDDGCAYGGSGCFYSVKEYSSGALNDVTSTSTTMSQAKGFELYIGTSTSSMSEPDTIDVSGTVPAPGSISQSSFSTANGLNLTLTGNTYASQIDWAKVHSMSNDLQDYYYVACATGNYETYDISTSSTSSNEVNDNGIIGSFQGFWAEGNGGGSPSVNFDQTVKASTDPHGFAKSESKIYDEEVFGLKMSSKMNSFSCRSKVRFDANASRNKDNGLDIPHMPAPVEEAPELVFQSRDGEALRRQSINSFEDEVTLPVVAKTPVKGTYTLDVEHLDAIDQYDCMKLVDLKTRKTYKLREQSTIQFDITEKENEDPRFNLVLSRNGSCKAATSVEDEKASGPIVNITQDQSGANVRVDLEEKQEVRVKLYDMTGRPVRESESFTAEQMTKRISAPENSGIYMIVVETANDRVTKKVKF